jgi:signal transduction histidine kinase
MYTLESLEKHIPQSDQALQARISEALSVASDALGSLRRVIRDLRPAVLDDLGLVSATRWYARSKLEAAGVLVEFQADAESVPLSSEMNITFFRIAQEAINNISRHAHAENVCIRLGLDQDEVFMDIKDDGMGFQVAGNTAEAIHLNHWGLAGIQERINLVNGRLIVESAQGKGTHLQVRAPLYSPQVVTDG